MLEEGYRGRKTLARSMSDASLIRDGSTAQLAPRGPDPGASVLPSAKFIDCDRVVLRFYGYFKEAVHENPVENFRVRKLVLYYYMEDDTIQEAGRGRAANARRAPGGRRRRAIIDHRPGATAAAGPAEAAAPTSAGPRWRRD